MCAVVVTYRPDESLIENLRTLQQEIQTVFVVDNTPDENDGPWQSFLEQSGATLIRNRKNLGIGAALNIGIRLAIDSGCKWVATFDQDSKITPGYFESMLLAFESCPMSARVALIAPVLCYSAAECASSRARKLNAASSLTPTAMTSGSLIRSDVFATEGFYDESLFMDYVDYEFCLRLRKHGWKLVRVQNARLLHRLGLPQTHSFFGFKISIKSHNAWRRYYIMRNRLIVFRRYGFSSPGWCLYDFFWIFLELTKIVLFERDKANQFRATARGLWHGILGDTSQSP